MIHLPSFRFHYCSTTVDTRCTRAATIDREPETATENISITKKDLPGQGSSKSDLHERKMIKGNTNYEKRCVPLGADRCRFIHYKSHFFHVPSLRKPRHSPPEYKLEYYRHYHTPTRHTLSSGPTVIPTEPGHARGAHLFSGALAVEAFQ